MLSGKGDMQTFWVKMNRRSAGRSCSYSSDESLGFESTEGHSDVLSEETLRLVDWNVEILTKTLKQIIARREVLGIHREHIPRDMELEQADDTDVRHRVNEVMDLPPFDNRLTNLSAKANAVKLSAAVLEQLYSFFMEIAKLYNDNPFHNFSHGKWSLMSQHLLTRYLIQLVMLWFV
jgi:hypothetical protein